MTVDSRDTGRGPRQAGVMTADRETQSLTTHGDRRLDRQTRCRGGLAAKHQSGLTLKLNTLMHCTILTLYHTVTHTHTLTL